MGPFQYLMRRLIVISHKVLKLWDLYLELYECPEIWQALRQHCCRGACQISKWCCNLNYQSRGFETSQDLMRRRIIWYWNRAHVQLYKRMFKHPVGLPYLDIFFNHFRLRCCQCPIQWGWQLQQLFLVYLYLKMIHLAVNSNAKWVRFAGQRIFSVELCQGHGLTLILT